ncbi:MAG: hypothetical protein U0893_18420 [Chloroflexota bacterium]
MTTLRLRNLLASAALGLTILGTAALPAAAAGLDVSAGATVQGAYGPDTCINGYVWREAIPSDHVCVTPATRSQTAYDNSQAVYRRDPNGAYGSNTCVNGYVWREAFVGDAVCVTPATRSQAKYDNSQAPYRVAR